MTLFGICDLGWPLVTSKPLFKILIKSNFERELQNPKKIRSKKVNFRSLLNTGKYMCCPKNSRGAIRGHYWSNLTFSKKSIFTSIWNSLAELFKFIPYIKRGHTRSSIFIEGQFSEINGKNPIYKSKLSSFNT